MDYLTKQLETELNKLKDSNCYRELSIMQGTTGRIATGGGRELVLMASNNYLGLTTHPLLQEAAAKAIWEYGTGTGAARLVSGSLPPHAHLENALACFKGTEAALLFNTGYMANLGVITSLVGPKDVVYSDELNHASIIDGCRLSKAVIKVYRHGDPEHLAHLLRRDGDFRRRMIVTDGVFSMDGDLAPLPELVNLAREERAFLMVDDAHGTGVLGEHGRGTVEYFNLEGAVDIQVGTLSKALGSEGGFVVGNRQLVDYLRNKARSFIFSTALSPAVVAASLVALKVIGEEPQRRQQLLAGANYLRERLNRLGYTVLPGITPILPVVIGEAKAALALARHLLEHGVYSPAIRPPTVPEGSSRIRVTVMATHTMDELDRVVEVFSSFGR